MPDAPRVGLVLQGGGARGAYRVGVLRAVAEFSRRRRSPFPIVSGTSVGAINAAPLAAGSQDFPNCVRRIEALWRSLHCSSIYDTGSLKLLLTALEWSATMALGGLGIGNPQSLLDNGPLRRLLTREFAGDGVRRSLKSGALHALCITASSYDIGRAVTFFEAVEGISGWHRARRAGRRARITVPHLMASSSLPFLFAPERIDGGYFGDGSLRLTAPLSPAIRTGAERLVVIGGRDLIDDAAEVAPVAARPSLGQMAGHALDIHFNDNLDADLERLYRVNDLLALMTARERQETPLRIIEPLIVTPSRDLRSIAADHADDMPRAIRMLLGNLGSRTRENRLVSYLLFEPGYVGSLIALGYADTMEREGDLRRFLGIVSHRARSRSIGEVQG